MKFYVLLWLALAAWALLTLLALVLAVMEQEWFYAALDAFYLASSVGLGLYLRAHPPLD